jgi:hypothetical protein
MFAMFAGLCAAHVTGGGPRQHELLRVGARYAFTRVLTQRVRDFVAYDGCELGVGEVERVDEAGVDHDAAAWHAIGVQLLGLLHVELPVPLGGVGPEHRGHCHDPLRNGGHSG